MVAKVRCPVNRNVEESSTESGSELEEDYNDEGGSVSDPYDDQDVNDQILRQRRKSANSFQGII